MTQPIEWYVENADELAQKVVNVWGPHAQAGQQDVLGSQFLQVFDRSCRYRTIKDIADNHREFGMLTEREAAEEKEARRAFAEAYKEADDKAKARAAG
jgi:hypothetical protein